MFRKLGLLLAAFAVLTTAQACIPQDIMFMVDTSSGVGANNFREELEFVKSTIRNYHVSAQCIRVGIMTFSGQVYNNIKFGQYSTTSELMSAIDQIQYQPGRRYTTEALKYLNSNVFGQFGNARAGAQHIGVLVSNGQASNALAFAQEAKRVRDSGTKLYTVGIGTGFHLQDLKNAASNPHSRYAMNAQNFDSLGDLAYPLSTRTNSDTQQLPAASGCLQKADLVFAVDGSGSIGPQNFAKLQDFLKRIVTELNIGPDAVHVGLVKFSNYPSIEFPLDMYMSRQEVLTAIDNINYVGGGTNTAEAINYMNHQVFNQKSGARPNVPRIAVVITDGRSSNPTNTANAANQARADHIGMMSIGIGAGVDQSELQAIADNPDSQNMFMVNTYDQLKGIVSNIINRACQVRSVAPVATTRAPGASLPPDPCQDVQPNCKSFQDDMCTNYAPWAKDNCARFCGFCRPLYTTAPPPCVDRLTDCASYGLFVCSDARYKDWAGDNCRKFCGFCLSNGATGFFGKCYYKGKQYQHGEKWMDGCDYECVCEDGASGRYQCYNRCPLYYDLPAECTLVQNPSECCQQPVCNFNQQIQTFTSNSLGRLPSGLAVCAYKQGQYIQGQTWQDGCDFQCSCVNAQTGEYRCQDLCPTYGSVPPYCHMTKTDGECCAKPVCDFTTQQGSFTGTGSVSGKGVALTPTTPAPCVNAIANCERYGTDVCNNFAGWASDNCRSYCGLCNVKPTPGPEEKCMFDGREFGQNEGWMLSCDTKCVCEDAIYGYYRCTNICPKYSNLPAGCYETKRSGDCCASVQCDSGTILTSTNNLNTIGSGGLISVKNPTQPQVFPTAPGGLKPQPGTGGTGMQAPSLRGCLYKGHMYLQDQMWEDGCQFSCVCKSAQNGYYECSTKCPTYPNLPVGCHLETDDSEPCCQKPVCNDPKTPVIPVFGQGTTGHGVVRPPSVPDLFPKLPYTITYPTLYNKTVAPPTANPGTIKPVIGYCEYKGQRHLQGENWDDGCDYKCVCEDASIGRWRCKERCVKYNNLPQQCRLVTSQLDACCKDLLCDFTAIVNHITGKQTVTPRPITTTPKPTSPAPKMCVYGGRTYSENQVWYDGCKYRCTCDNAQHGFYRCTNRCPEYQNVPAGCTMVPDSQDPACCKVPSCNFTPAPGGNTGVVTLSPASFQGSGTGTGNIGYCLYKGVQYQQGQKWDDGCQYKCECKDARSGLYQCDETCPRYGNLPYPCKLITDFRNPCCKVPDCQFNGNVGEITGTLTPAPGLGTTLVPPIPGQKPKVTPAPVLNYCLYRGVKYYQGQTWDDGCDKRCRCDDATKGYYTCDDRCPKYNTLPKECQLITDPSDPCCQKPQCDFQSILKNITGTVPPNLIPTLAPPARVTGQVNTPAPTPGPGPTPAPITKCLYKGVQYSQGMRWDDGCQYTCICTEAMKGKYVCDEKCPKWPALPPECQLQKDPANPCCYKPECVFNPNVGEITGLATTKVPHIGPTAAPTPYTGQPTPAPYATPALPKAVCVYKGKSYTQGQSWYDGCDYKCTCEDAEQGIYRCSQRCSQYQNLPKDCYLVADDQDPICCKVPKCNIPSQYNNQSGILPLPTAAPGIISGGSVTKAPTPGTTQAPQPGQPNPTPGPTPAPKEMCIYKGRDYAQGQKWQDGCDYNCECTNAKMGFYRCTEKCPRYNNLPPQCKLVADVMNPCCQKPYCDFTGSTGQISGTMTPAPGMVTTRAPLPPGQTYPPTPGPTPKIPDTCVYNGVQFKQGQTWDDGCDLKCVCENGMTGFYRCSDRCARYNSVPQGCVLVTDPSDSCCRVPSCSPQPQVTPAPLPGQTPNPFPTLTPPTVPAIIIGQGITPTPRPGQPTPATSSPPVPVCMYKGKTYTQGQKFDDGCDLHCECYDAMNGKYKCTKRCQKYVNLPSNCRLSIDPNDACCRIATCLPTPSPFLTPGPSPGGPTIKPNPNNTPVPNPVTPGPTPAPQPKNVCLMKGRQYTQGQTWFDGCDKKCVCEDGTTGFYRCSDRCREYKNVPATCTMVPDPSDPQCCQLPQCIPGVNGYPTPVPQQTPAPGVTIAPTPMTGQPLGVVTGFAPSPTPTAGTTLAPKPGQPNPTPGPTPAPKMVCVYKGKAYGQGQRWQDGCDFNCVCTDGMTGKYECTERCPSYPAVPQYCHMEADPSDFCCQRPVCDYNKPVTVPTPAPNMQTTIAPIPGQPTPVNTPAPTPAPAAFCVYNGVAYQQGKSWNVGCDKQCRCDDASKNIYNCADRCPSYQVKPGCTYVTDPSDPCCQIPSCLQIPTPVVTPTPGPGVNPTPGPNLTPSATPYPSPLPQGVTGSVIVKPPVPNLGYCEYMGKQYKTGEKWDDGCRYHCTCIDSMSGQYKCDERCPRYPQVPSYCVLVQDPTDNCCKVPQCTIVAPTPQPPVSPSPGVTLVPNPGSTLSPLMTPPTQPPQPVLKNVCIMKGKSYTQGQTWDDGCDKICVCDDGKTGHYSCKDRCPTYQNISPSCVMVPDPSDPVCCKMPQCTNPNNNVVPTGVYGQVTGLNPTPVPNLQPTPGNQNTPVPIPNNVPTPYPGGTYAPNMIPSVYPTVAPNPNQTPNPNPTPQPQPKVCIYNGQQYPQGVRWRDGCKYDCICENGMTGKYTCTDICPRYPPLPANCRMVSDPANPCCKRPDCSNPTPVPGPNNTPNPNPTLAPKIEFCIYNGVPYRQGQTWQDGCSKVCRCEDAAAKQVTCNDRCPTYPKLQPGCSYITDPSDQCCQVPKCTPTNNQTVVVTGPKGTIDGNNVVVPNRPNTGITGRSNVCLYKGKMYNQGQSWDDGCTYHCVCLDSSTGHYQCTERCFKIPQLPPYCTLVNDPQDQCCQRPYCQNPQPTPGPNVQPTPGITLVPNPNGTPAPTPAPQPKNVCVYKGNMYQQNQQWYDGCNAKCRCENSQTGYYRCEERCARYDQIPSACIMVADPADPSCCKVPQCPVKPTAGPTPTPGFIPNPLTPKPGVITGIAPNLQPTLTPPPVIGGTTKAPTPKKGCLYRGVVYNQGSKWDDGCDYQCECLDDMTGQYKCVQRCAKYPNLDSHCVLVQDPSDPCCEKPFCDYVNPTPFPTGVPTPNPYITPSPKPGQNTVAPTPVPRPTFSKCVYKGVFYSQGQTWQDGCDFTCQCDDSMNNLYTCHKRCKTYSQVPAGCKLTTDPSDQCCLVPNCNINLFPNTPGTVVGGTTPAGYTVNPQYYTGPSGTRPQYIYPTPIQPGTFIGTNTGQNPFVPNTGTSFTGSNQNMCIYKGKIYQQGQKWDDGCDYRCECFDATRGQYRCTDRCPSYPFLPPQCTYVQDPKDQCCQMARCDSFQTPNPNPIRTPTPGPNTPSPNGPTTHQPINITPGQNTGPVGTVTPPNQVTQTITGRTDMCMYKNTLYARGQRWQDGCNLNCICESPVGNHFRCTARCKSYSSIPNFCTLVQDPNDACCSTVRCNVNGQQLTPLIPDGRPTPSPTLAPNMINVVPLGTHTVITGSGLPNGQVPGATGGRSVCIYHGQVYKQGESWDDGCKYVCTCEDGSTGMYKCTSKCPQYPAIPSFCSFTKVPGQCCPSLHCNSPTFGNYNPLPQLVPTPRPNVTPTPGNPNLIVQPQPGTGTSGQNPIVVSPGTSQTSFTGNTDNFCIYKGKLYNKGDKWDDGCDYSCECLEGRSGYYQCKPKCPTYPNMPSQCYMTRTPGECCNKPMCTGPDGSAVNPLLPNSKYPVYGSFGGQFTGFRPNYIPGQVSVTGNRTNVCIYKGRVYQQNQRWEDGCDYSCECIDASMGQYRCTARCPTYNALPSACRMFDVPGDCCKEVRCDNSQVPPTPLAPTPLPNTPVPHIDQNCYDAISNCKAYGQQACSAMYDAWSRKNCNLTCGHCVPSVTAGPKRCEDKLTNCASYGKSACTGVYKPWAEDNCIKYCGYCTGGSGTGTTSTTGLCVDKINNCASYGQYACKQPYLAWAQENCPRYCNFCSGTGTGTGPIYVTSQPIVALPGQGWMVMMKGVSGVPGNLYQMWQSPNTVNGNVPQAMYLTSQYPGHFKPDLANHWEDLCIDKVKVAIYNNGVEKANIVFNAIGADKNSWFDKSRIISSTYTDIQNAPKEFFSMIGDATSGRQFYMSSSSSNRCNVNGWMMVSTQNGCPFEQSSGNKPTFLYAPGNQMAHSGQNSFAEGDVMAILAHADCSIRSTAAPTGITGTTDVCIYKQKIYQQGQSWVDGCDYNCTCVDGKAGRYMCNSLCPTFNSLPPGCTLQKPAGECCSYPYCNGVLIRNGTLTGMCVYKGTTYTLGQKWSDGCKYNCECVDGNTGRYVCKEKCYTWNLPDVCSLDPPGAGYCCSTPNCPSYVQITYPQGYVKQ